MMEHPRPSSCGCSMSTVIYNETNPLPATGVEGVDLAVIDYDIEAAPVAAVSAVNVSHLIIGKNRAISGDQWGLYLLGPAITVTNEGTIQAQSNGISLFAPGALTVF